MIKKLFLIILVLVILSSLALAQDYSEDLRAVRLKKFLSNYPWTPLTNYIEDILYWADYFGLDYRLYVAISGAESTYGKRYPKSTHNLTGYNSCDTSFSSIKSNIYHTHRTIATTHYYKKYRATKNINDLVYVYKGVPPFEHYIHNMRYALDSISEVSIYEEKVNYLANKAQNNLLTAYNTVRYDKQRNKNKVCLNFLGEGVFASNKFQDTTAYHKYFSNTKNKFDHSKQFSLAKSAVNNFSQNLSKFNQDSY